MVAGDGSRNILVADSGSCQIRQLTPTNGFFPIGIATVTPPSEPVQLANADGVIPNGDRPYVAYAGGLAAGDSTLPQGWVFGIPNGVTAFEFTVTVEANTALWAPPEAVLNPGPDGAGSPNVRVRTLAGGNYQGFLDGIATQARFDNPCGVAVDGAGNVFVADMDNRAVRRISASGMVSTVAGVVGSAPGSVDGSGAVATFQSVSRVAVSVDGTTVFVADEDDHRVRRVALTGGDPTMPDSWTVSTVAGTGAAGKDDGPGSTATVAGPVGIALDSGGNVYVVEVTGNRVRRIQYRGGDPTQPANWQVSLLAGDNSTTNGASGSTDGTGSAARFYAPTDIAADRAGNLYVTEVWNNRIRKITPDGVVTTLAGSSSGYHDDTTGSLAQFWEPRGIAVDSAGYAYVADTSNRRVRRISPSGAVMTVAGTGTSACVDGPGDVAEFVQPLGAAVDAAGNVYVVDKMAEARIRVIQRVIGTRFPSAGSVPE
jgi:sugar lactone lactonase YvrE